VHVFGERALDVVAHKDHAQDGNRRSAHPIAHGDHEGAGGVTQGAGARCSRSQESNEQEPFGKKSYSILRTSWLDVSAT
jgi:hypothetical protein